MSHCYSSATDSYGCEAKCFLLFSIMLMLGFHLLAEHRQRHCLFRFLWYALYLLVLYMENKFIFIFWRDPGSPERFYCPGILR